MYWTMPSGTRYHTGSPRRTRSRHAVEEMASAGISTSEALPSGSPGSVSVCPGRVQPTKWAISTSSSASRQEKIWPSASAPVMKKKSTSPPRSSRRSLSVSTVYVGPPRSMSTRLTEKRGLEAVAMTVIR
jgi:hypothetical protein